MGSYTKNLYKRGHTRTSKGGPKAERLVSCAIQRGGELHHGGKSHYELRSSLGDENPSTSVPGDREGFYTSAGRFVDRVEARYLGEWAGQCSPSSRELLSSDVNKWG